MEECSTLTSESKPEVMEFKKKIEELRSLSTRAQATFAHGYIRMIGAALCRTIIRYCIIRLNEINDALPDDDPGKIIHNDISTKQLRKFRASKAGME